MSLYPNNRSKAKAGRNVRQRHWHRGANVLLGVSHLLFLLPAFSPLSHNLTNFLSANANPFKVCFWLLSYMIYDPKLLQAIREETAPSITEDGKVDMQTLLNNSPLLDAAFHETLRVTSVNSSARNIEAPVIVDHRTLQTDGKIMMPYRQLHLDESVFGPETKNFDPDRFLKNKDLSRSPSFKPFGGGSTYCSGRFIAKREVMAFIALTIYLYDLRLKNPEQAFPTMDETKPTLGIMDPVVANRLLLINTPRV